MDDERMHGDRVSLSSRAIKARTTANGHRRRDLGLFLRRTRYAPVLRIKDRRGDWVLKRTGLVHSTGGAIADWLAALQERGIGVVKPSNLFSPNPRRLSDGFEWVVYPFVYGTGYRATIDEIAACGRLLGQMHAADVPEARALKLVESPIVLSSEWIDANVEEALPHMRKHGLDHERLRELAYLRVAQSATIRGLPLAGCSFDFKASNLVFSPAPVLVDPDHAARMPRLSDLAVALLLFHCDHPSAPGRVLTEGEWQAFVGGYREHVSITPAEMQHWNAVLVLAWLDQALWLLGHWPEGWDNEKDARFLTDLAFLQLDRFSTASGPVKHD